MKITAGFLLFCVAAAVSATPSKHHDVHRSNAQDNRSEMLHPRQQNSGDRGVIGSLDNETESRRLPNDGNGSEDARRGLGAPQALRNGQEGRHGYRRTANSNNDDVVESRGPDTISQQPARRFRNRGSNEGAEPASNVGQLGTFSGDGGRLGGVRRGNRNGYRSRVPSDDDSRSSEEDRPEYGRRYRPRVRSDDDSRSSEENPEYGRRYRPRVRSNGDSRSSEESPKYGRGYHPRKRSDDSRSSEEDMPRRRDRPQYPRRSGDDSSEREGRPFGPHRRTALRGFDRSD